MGFLPPGGRASAAHVASRLYETVEKDTVVAAHGGRAVRSLPIGRSAARDATISIDHGVVYVSRERAYRYADGAAIPVIRMAAERAFPIADAGLLTPEGYHTAAGGNLCRSIPPHLFRVTTFGRAWAAIGCVVDAATGLARPRRHPAYLDKRRRGHRASPAQTARADEVKILPGIHGRGMRAGRLEPDCAPHDMVDQRSKDYRHQGQVPAGPRRLHL